MVSKLQLEQIINDLGNYKIAIDAHAIVAITDKRGLITKVNSNFCNISQYSQEELLGKSHSVINSGFHPKIFFKNLWLTISNGDIWKGEICNRAKDGGMYWVDTTILPFRDSNGVLESYISIRTDITKLKKAEEHAHYLAFHDDLTGLPNRRFMQESIEKLLDSCILNDKYSALMILDLDNFKNINDTLGHDYGDLLLKKVSTRLALCIIQRNSIVRLGGDEFLITLSDLHGREEEVRRDILLIANQILRVLNEPFELHDRKICTSISIGVFIFSDCKLKKSEVLKYADMALYKAKRNGKNQVCIFDPTIERSLLKQNALLVDLRMALVREEFKLYYQIMVDQDQYVVGYEALLRWQHPKYGVILPETFIKLAEQSELITEIGNQVLIIACKQLKKWSENQESSKWKISVNLSVDQFKNSGFDKNVISIIEEYEVNPALLHFELTESTFYKDITKSIEIMNRLIDHGLKFSMDDFGTGYSSFNYLKILPLEQLKIDRSFVEHIVDNPSDLEIVKVIIQLAKILGLKVVAEGVETKKQFLALREGGCDIFQGYYFGYPEVI